MKTIIQHLDWKIVDTAKAWDPMDNLVSCITPPVTKDMVRFLDIAIIGKAGCGKSTTEKRLAEMIHDFYVEKGYGVNAFMSQSFIACIEAMHRNPQPINILIIDDPLKNYQSRGGSNAEMKKAIGKFHELRHELENALNASENDEIMKNTGVVFTIIGSQSYKILDKTWRSGVLQLFKTNVPEDEKEVRNCIRDGKLYKRLQEITLEVYVNHKDNMRANMVAVFAGVRSGEIKLPMPTRDVTIWVEESKMDERQKTETWNDKIDKYTEAIMTQSGINLGKGAGRLVRDWLRRTYPQDWQFLNKQNNLRDIMDSCYSYAVNNNLMDNEGKVTTSGDDGMPINIPGAYEPPKLGDYEFYTYNEAEELLRFPALYKTKERTIHAYILLYHPKEFARLVREGKLDLKKTLKSKTLTVQDVEQSASTGHITQNDLAEVFGISQYQISGTIGRGNQSKQALRLRSHIDYDRGHKFERYVQKRFEDGYSLCYKDPSTGEDKVFINAVNLKDINMDGKTGAPDLILTTNDDVKYYISIKTATESGSRSVNIDEINPELELFKKKLTSTDFKTDDKLLILIRNMHFPDFLSFCSITSEDPQYPWESQVRCFEDFQKNYTFNEHQRQKGVKPYAFWMKVVDDKKQKALDVVKVASDLEKGEITLEEGKEKVKEIMENNDGNVSEEELSGEDVQSE